MDSLQKQKRSGQIKLFFIFLSISSVCFSCKLGPNYSRSADIDHSSYRQEFADGPSIANTPWWELFGDSTLTNLIWTSLKYNRDLNTAISRIDESMASMAMVRADLYPRINYGVYGSSTVNTETSEVLPSHSN